MSELISTRIEKEISKDIEKLARERKVGKTILLRELIIKGLSGMKLDLALDLYSLPCIGFRIGGQACK